MRWRAILILWTVAGLMWGLDILDRPGGEPEGDRRDPAGPRLVEIASSEVERVRFTRGAFVISVRRTDQTWQVEGKGTRSTVPVDLIEAFVESITGIEVLDTVGATSASQDGYGFATRRETIEIVAALGERVVLEIGNPSPTGTAVYVRTQDGRVHLVGRNPFDYRDLILDAATPTDRGGENSPLAAQRLTIEGQPV